MPLPLFHTANWTLAVKQGAAEAPRSGSGARMPTGTVEDITGDHEGGKQFTTGNLGARNWPVSEQRSSHETGVSLHWC